MIPFFIGMVGCLGVSFRSRYNLGTEILALRQQLGELNRKNPRPRLRFHDRMFRVLFRRLWPSSSSVPVIVRLETVVAWRRAGFRSFWRLPLTNRLLGPKIDGDVGAPIRRMVVENPSLRRRGDCRDDRCPSSFGWRGPPGPRRQPLLTGDGPLGGPDGYFATLTFLL